MDNDVDGLLLQQFSSMATQDRDVLIAQFKSFLGNHHLNDVGCAFFLDMNNWNLQDAICSYFEYQNEATVIRLPRMTVVTHGEDDGLSQTPTISAPCDRFTKVWHVANSGDETWPPGCSLRFFAGSQMTTSDRVMVDNLSPGASACVRLEVTSPAQSGTYKAQWRMSTITGTFFGETLWLVVQVVGDGAASMDEYPTLTPANQVTDSEQHADVMDMS